MGANLTLVPFEPDLDDEPFVETALEVKRDYALYTPLWEMENEGIGEKPTPGLLFAFETMSHDSPKWVLTVQQVRAAFHSVLDPKGVDAFVMNRAVLAYLDVLPGEWKVALCWL